MLSENDYKLTMAALDALSARQSEIAADCRAIAEKLGRDEILLEIERHLLALALQGYALHMGPDSFDDVDRISRELGVGDEFMAGLMSFLACAGNGGKPRHG